MSIQERQRIDSKARSVNKNMKRKNLNVNQPKSKNIESVEGLKNKKKHNI